MSEKKHIPERSPDNTTIGFSCPKDFKQKLLKMAAEENRSLSNWLVHHLTKAIREENARAGRRAAETNAVSPQNNRLNT